MCILGGDSESIAKVMAEQKTMGAATVGNTVVTYLDNTINYAYQYNVQRPTDVALYVKVQYKDNLYSPIQSTVTEQIKAVLQEYVANHPFVIGQTISGPDLSAAFADFNTADIISISVSTDDTTYTQYVATTIKQVAILSTDNITVEKV